MMPPDLIGCRPTAPVLLVALLTCLTACPSSESSRSDTGARPEPAVTEVDEPPPGFATAALITATPAPSGSATGANAPSGSLWYKISPSAASPSGRFTLEWFVHLQHVLPGRAYRVDMTVDGQRIYSIGSGHASGGGTITLHGVLHRFEDRYCVSTPTLPQPFVGRHSVAIGVKSDGAGSGSPSQGDPLTDPGRDFSCDGNGDNDFQYWAVTRAPVTIDAAVPTR